MESAQDPVARETSLAKFMRHADAKLPWLQSQWMFLLIVFLICAAAITFVIAVFSKIDFSEPLRALALGILGMCGAGIILMAGWFFIGVLKIPSRPEE